MLKLNMGCGDQLKPNYVNVDLYNPEADLHIDLFKHPWPWEDSCADEIYMEHFLEHCPNLLGTISEVYRLLKPGGKWHVIVPHARSIHAHALGHEQMFTYCSFAQLCSPGQWYSPSHNVLFKTESFRARLLKFHSISWTPLDCIASKFPIFWEKFAFSALTPTDLEWIGTAVK